MAGLFAFFKISSSKIKPSDDELMIKVNDLQWSVAEKEAVIRQMSKALEKSVVALRDLRNIYDPLTSNSVEVGESMARIGMHGAIRYLSSVEEEATSALTAGGRFL